MGVQCELADLSQKNGFTMVISMQKTLTLLLTIITLLSATIILSSEERHYIDSVQSVTIVTLDGIHGFSYKEDGKQQGFSIDIISLISEKTGLTINLEVGSWTDNFPRFKRGDVELIDFISYKKERLPFTRYTKPYYEIPVFIFSNKETPFTSLHDLDGSRVGIGKDLYYEDALRELSNIKVVEYGSREEKMKALANGSLDFALNNIQSANKIIKQHGFSHIGVVGELNLPSVKNEDFRIGVNRDNLQLFSIINRGMNSISTKEIDSLQEKWFGIDFSNITPRNVVPFTEEERIFLDSIGEIKMCVDPNWLPYEEINSKGIHEGIVADYHLLFEQRLMLPVKLVKTSSWNESLEFARSRKCDILSAANITPEREKYLSFTAPFLESHYAIVTKIDVPFIERIETITNRELGVVKGYSLIERIRNEYPKIKIVEVENIQDGISQVQSGDIYGFIDAIPALSYEIQKSLSSDLKISGTIPLNMDLSVAIRNDSPLLLSIYSKVVNSISQEEKREIHNRWISVRLDEVVDYSRLWRIVLIFTSLFIVILLWNYKLYSEIRHRKKIQSELEEQGKRLEIAKAEAERANHAKSDFLSNMSHELRTPLNAVIGFSELLSTITEDCKQKRYVDSIKVSGRSLLMLINDILDLSKIESGVLNISPTCTNIDLLLSETSLLFSSRLETKQIEYSTTIHLGEARLLMVDEIRVRQILINLIGNAEKFTEEGSIKVIVEKLTSSPSESHIDISISVEDSGIGIANKNCDEIFETFKQHNDHDTTKYGGTGLGLAISKKLAQAMGGDLIVTSELGVGSKFKLQLNNVEVVNSEFTYSSDEKETLSTVHFSGGTILIVDDIPLNLELMDDMLQTIGFSIITAENGKVAIEQLKNHKVDIIFMDIRMPVMNGTKATSIIKNDPHTSDIPVVALTASSSAQDKDEIMSFGFDEYLAKPFDTKDLITILSRWFQKRSDLITSKIGSSVESTNFVDIPSAAQLLIEIESTIIPLCESLQKGIVITDVEQLSSELLNLSQNYDINELYRLSTNLSSAATSFDITLIERCISELFELERKWKNEYRN